MHLPPLSRAIAFAWTLLVVISGPGLAVAHGTAHKNLATPGGQGHEHGHHFVAELAHEAPAHGSPSVHAAIHEADSPAEHPHPTVAVAYYGRLDFPALVVTAATEVPVAIVAFTVSAPVRTVISSRDGPPPDSPRQPRAPPLG